MSAAPAREPSTPICLRPDGPRRWSDLLADAQAMRGSLAGHGAICNLAQGRYEFAAMLLAALAEGVTTILPSSRAEGAVAAALDGADRPLVVETPGLHSARSAGEPLRGLDGEVHVFTSGSTGLPVRHVKNWMALAGGARLTAQLIARAGLRPGRALIVGTTPHQHMFGLEAVIFAGLAHGHCFADASVFYPADLDDAVARAGRAGFADIVLVTSPPHLRFLEERIRALPQIRCIISATAPLDRGLAARLEDEGGRFVFEIYGSTETGSLAWRRTAAAELWTLLDGVRLVRGGPCWQAILPHLPGAIALPDDISPEADGRFRLLGRRGDMVRIAGKRQSLGALNAALAGVAGIADAVMLRESAGGEDRLAVYVVPAPGGETDPEALAGLVREHLRRHVDPVFIPRRVAVVSALPRNATGKILAGDVAALASADARIAARRS